MKKISGDNGQSICDEARNNRTNFFHEIQDFSMKSWYIRFLYIMLHNVLSEWVLLEKSRFLNAEMRYHLQAVSYLES